MSNPFAGIITNDLKDLFNNMIDSLLEDTALTVPCRILFGTSKNTECPNCLLDPIGMISSNVYRPGGPLSFITGSICPQCGGVGFIPSDNSTIVYLGTIWNKSKFIKGLGVNIADIDLQTLSKINTYPNLLQAKEITFDTNIEGYGSFRYQLEGALIPLGWGRDSYILGNWRRAG